MTEPAHSPPRKSTKGTTTRKAGPAPVKARSHHRKVPAAVDVTGNEPLDGEVLRPRMSPKTSRVISNAARWIQGMLPAADGGPPPVVTAARTRFAGWLWAAVGLFAGCVAGLLTVLLLAAVPNVPSVLLGLAAGAFLGASIALLFASRFPMVRKAGGMAILLLPLLVLATPFLLLAGGVALLMRFPKRGRAAK